MLSSCFIFTINSPSLRTDARPLDKLDKRELRSHGPLRLHPGSNTWLPRDPKQTDRCLCTSDSSNRQQNRSLEVILARLCL